MSLLGLRDFLFFCFCFTIHFIYRYRRKSRLPLPPTLTGWPIVGNAFQIPLMHVHIFYKKLGQNLGSKIMYLEPLGKPMIVINDANIARELFEKRSGLYSSRPEIPMLTDVARVKIFLGFMPYGDRWRHQRRMFQQYFSPKTIYRQQKKSLEFVQKGLLPNLYERPEDVREHVRSCVGGISTAMTYGLPIRRAHEPLVETAEKTFTATALASGPGNYLVNVLPALKYVPDWIPGATFKKTAQEIHEQTHMLMEESYQLTLKSTNDGTALDSFVSANIERIRDLNAPEFELQEQHIKEVSCQVFGAMSETTVATTMTFILAMLRYPEVQRKAQQEIDSVVGSDRLPKFSDQSHLPYFSAVLKEVLRWNPIVPIGIPHMTSGEDVYEGYYIPKNCTVFANTYAILHDEEIFPNPSEFDPDRFIRDGVPLTDVPDPSIVATFGFGRRICPGSHIALSTIDIIATSLLAVFDILPAHDADGKPIEAAAEFTASSLISEPLPFQCKFTPRQGKDVEGLLREYLGTEVISV